MTSKSKGTRMTYSCRTIHFYTTPVLKKIFMSFPPSKNTIFKPMYKFCNILFLGGAWPSRTKKFAGGAGNFGFVETSSRQHPDVLANIEDINIASEFISFRDDVASSMELLSDF